LNYDELAFTLAIIDLMVLLYLLLVVPRLGETD
jgi:hypothetical protein